VTPNLSLVQTSFVSGSAGVQDALIKREDQARSLSFVRQAHSLSFPSESHTKHGLPRFSQNGLTFLRVRSKKHEIMVAPGEPLLYSTLVRHGSRSAPHFSPPLIASPFPPCRRQGIPASSHPGPYGCLSGSDPIRTFFSKSKKKKSSFLLLRL
jgi:hypothetical protein